jgi:hypothetical protein
VTRHRKELSISVTEDPGFGKYGPTTQCTNWTQLPITVVLYDNAMFPIHRAVLGLKHSHDPSSLVLCLPLTLPPPNRAPDFPCPFYFLHGCTSSFIINNTKKGNFEGKESKISSSKFYNRKKCSLKKKKSPNHIVNIYVVHTIT